MKRFAIICTYNRPDDLQRCVDSIVDQVDRVLVVDNGSDPPVPRRSRRYFLTRDDLKPPNLSVMWNEALDWIAEGVAHWEIPEWDVAILNDDAIVPSGWFAHLSYAMRGYGAAAGSSAPFDMGMNPGRDRLWGPDHEPSVYTRVTGWAFMLPGEQGFRFDEQFQWWCGDDDLSMWARNHGGLVHIGGFPVQNVHANESTTGELLAQSAVDMQRFVDKWGKRPW